MKRLLPINFFFILLAVLLLRPTQNFYCSAYCSYFWDGGSYLPKCTDQTSSSCTKCDETLFTLSASSQCVPHGLFNQTLAVNDLNPASTSSGWTSLNGVAYTNLRSGLYNLIEFNADERYYKTFALPAHFAIRVRFFVLRVSAASFSFIYYLDDNSYSYPYNSFPSSQTLGDIVTTNLISHEDSNLSVAFQATSFGLGQFVGVKQLMVFVSRCSNGCTKCSSAVDCVSCGVVGASQSYLYQQKCLTLCPQQTYPDTGTLKCQSCAPQCYNCNSALITDCTQCVFQGRYETFLYGSQCYYTCPLGYFPEYVTNTCQCPSQLYFIDASNLNTCTSCSIECQTCFGSLRTQCSSCISGFYLVYGTTWCSNTCPSNQYINPFNNKCYPCAGACSSCQNTSTTCIGCFFTTMKYLHQNKCLLSCPDGYQPNNISRTCDACAPYEYSFNNTCGLECPTFYMASNESKSCIHLSQTNFTYSIQINKIRILFDGKTMQISISFEYELDAASIDWLLRQSYFNLDIKIGDLKSLLASTRRLQQEVQPVKVDISSSRILAASTYSVRGVSMSSNTFIFTTQVPSQFNYNLHFVIDFGLRLKNPSGISYANTTLFYSIQSDPQLLRQFYMYSQRYFYNIALIPLIFLAFVLIFIRIKGTYQLLMEYFRMMQLIGLTVFAAYPFKSQIYYLLDGFNYFNMEFFPNVYNWFVSPFSDTWAIQGFVFYYGDANFIRIIGSILIFIVVCFFALLVMKYLIGANPQNMGWTVKLCMDLAQIKILHSFWSSLIFTFGNSSSTNLVLYLCHIVSYFFMGFLIYRQLKIYQSTQEVNWLFFWRLIATLLFAVAAFSKLVVFVLLFILSIVTASLYYIRWPVNECKQYRFGFSVDLRNALITILPIMSIFVSGLIIFYEDQLTQQLQIIFVLAIVHFVMAAIVFAVICLNYLQKQKAQMIQKLVNAKNKAIKNQYYQELNKSTKSIDMQFDKQLQINNQQNMSYMARRTGIHHRQNTQGYIIDDQPIQKKFKAEPSNLLAESVIVRKQLDQIGQMQVNQLR